MNTNWKDAWTLMRIPFSLFLMPIFWLALSMLPLESWDPVKAVLVFLHLHLLVYPASNGYNSLIDQDETSIGGLENPPKVNVQLKMLVLVFEFLALSLGFILGLEFGFCVAVYWLMSRAYSGPAIRLKRFPILSWLTVVLFQGAWTVLMVWAGIVTNGIIFETGYLWIWPVVASIFLMGSYPVTQIYQHTADSKRGDRTLSFILGIRGTLLFALAGLLAGSSILILGLWLTHDLNGLPVIIISSSPSFIYFAIWMRKVWKDPSLADYRHTMLFNRISSISLSIGFLGHLVLKFFGISILLHP